MLKTLFMVGEAEAINDNPEARGATSSDKHRCSFFQARLSALFESLPLSLQMGFGSQKAWLVYLSFKDPLDLQRKAEAQIFQLWYCTPKCDNHLLSLASLFPDP